MHFFFIDQYNIVHQGPGKSQTRTEWNPRSTEANRGQKRLGQGPHSAAMSADAPGDGAGKETNQLLHDIDREEWQNFQNHYFLLGVLLHGGRCPPRESSGG